MGKVRGWSWPNLSSRANFSRWPAFATIGVPFYLFILLSFSFSLFVLIVLLYFTSFHLSFNWSEYNARCILDGGGLAGSIELFDFISSTLNTLPPLT